MGRILSTWKSTSKGGVRERQVWRYTTRRDDHRNKHIYVYRYVYIEGTSNFGRYIMMGYVKTESRVSPRLDPLSQVFGCVPRPVSNVMGLAWGRGLRADQRSVNNVCTVRLSMMDSGGFCNCKINSLSFPPVCTTTKTMIR